MRWLDALHVMDSAFPTGAYAHSFGLESFAPTDLGTALAARLNESIGRLDLVFVIHAYTHDLNELDTLLHASLLQREQRDASSAIGTSLLRAVCELLDDAALRGFRNEGQHHHHAVVWGAISNVLEVPASEAAEWYAFNSIRSEMSAAQRLGWIGQSQAQRVLHRLKPLVETTAARAASMRLEEAGSFAPAWDIASMRHERAAARMFAS